MNYLKSAGCTIILSSIFSLNPSAYADSTLRPLTDQELATETGQALFNLSYIAPGQDSNPNTNIGFYRLGLEANLELNANIKKLQLGCGGVNGANGCDIDIDNLRFTGLVDTDTVDAGPSSSFLASNPFIEFAIKNPDSASTREVSGLRLGFLEAFGKLSIGQPYQYNGTTLGFTSSNEANNHTGINSLSGDINTVIGGTVPLATCLGIGSANSTRTGCTGLSGAVPLGNATIEADTPNVGDNRFQLLLARASQISLTGIKPRYLGITLNADMVESLKFIHEIALGTDTNGNGVYDAGEGTKDFSFSLSSIGDNNTSSTANWIKWQRVSDPNTWYSSPRGWSLSIPQANITGFTSSTVHLGAFEALGALVGFTVELNNLDLGQRPVDNCYGGLTFC